MGAEYEASRYDAQLVPALVEYALLDGLPVRGA